MCVKGIKYPTLQRWSPAPSCRVSSLWGRTPGLTASNWMTQARQPANPTQLSPVVELRFAGLSLRPRACHFDAFAPMSPCGEGELK